jgi:DNA polymerase III subunit delta'
MNYQEPLKSKYQLSLFGYKDYFNFFTSMYKKNKLPNAVLLRGQKGIGKATFINHFINYLLSNDQEKKFLISSNKINANNKSYNLLSDNIHPNCFSLEGKSSNSEITIDQVRNMLKFINKSTYNQNLKIIMIDNAELLNRNAANALLKSLEEPSENTFFFLIHNSSCKILETVKSRCIEFNFFLNADSKKEILKNILSNYQIEYSIDDLIKNFYFDTPGNILKYLLILNNNNIDINSNNLTAINIFFEKYKKENNIELLTFVSLFTERFYTSSFINNENYSEKNLLNRDKILNYIYDMKKYNLDKNNLSLLINNILQHG